jgi:hypothetical protein
MSPHSWNNPHMIRAGKSLLRALYFTLGVFLFLFVIFHISGALYVSHIAKKATEDFQTGIAQDLAYLKEQGDEVAKDDLLQKYLIEQDSQKLIEFLQTEKKEREIGLMGVANSEGVILGRTKSVGVHGDNVFLTNPVARIVAQEKSAESVEAPVGFSPNQIFLTTGRPVIQDNRMIGALFANYLTDDAYAVRFQDTYLPAGVKVVFYNKDAGVYGNGFSDTETRKLINSYFNSGSELIQNGSSGKTISFKDGTFYLVENIIFPGLEKSPGGAFLFIPRYDFLIIVNIITAFLTVLTFILFAFMHHLHSRGEDRGWRYYALLFFMAIPVFILTLFVLDIKNTGYLKLERIPYALYNSTLRLQPEYGIYDVGFEQRFSIVVDTGDESINAVKIGLMFDPEAVEVKALETKNSMCSYVIENTIDDVAGKANLSCVVLKSDGERGSLPIADVVVVPKRIGTFTLSFDKEETQVLASDGLGTDVLRMSQSGSYRVYKFDPSLSISTATTTQSLMIFSPTHPNQSRWYNSNTASFVWRGKLGDVYKYAFDNSPDTIPSDSHTIQESAVTIPMLGDGIFYFHLQLASGGPVSHYRVEVDKTPPSITSIRLSADKIFVGDVVRLYFDSNDTGSGIQKNYYVDIGNHLFLPTGSQLFIPFLDAGDQKIVLRVYDNAGNYSEKSQIIHVEAHDDY